MNRLYALCALLLLTVALFSSCSAVEATPSHTGTANLYEIPSVSHEGNGSPPQAETVAAFTASAGNDLIPLTSAPSEKQTPKSDVELDSALIEAELLKLINALRVENNVEKLETDDLIISAARVRSSELQNSFSHTRPDGTSYYTVFDKVGFTYSDKWHGENASSVYFSNAVYAEKKLAKMMFDELKKSPGHTKNMLRKQYGLAGIGCNVKVEDNTVYVASSQLFASK